MVFAVLNFPRQIQPLAAWDVPMAMGEGIVDGERGIVDSGMFYHADCRLELDEGF